MSTPGTAAGTGRGRRQTRITRATTNTIGAGALLLVLSASTRDGWLVLLAGLAFGVVLAAVLLRPRLDALDVAITLPARGRAGEPLTATLTVTNRAGRGSPAATVAVTASGLDAVSVRLPPLGANESATCEFVLVPRRRGELRGLSVTVRTSAPLTVLTVQQERTVPASLLVHPALGTPLTLVPGGIGEAATTAAATNGLDVQGIREWHHGEAAGRLYARGTARRGTPLVLDRHDDLGHGIAFVVAGGAANPLWEPMVSLVAATVVEAAGDARPLAVLARQPDLADAGGNEPTALLDWFARLGAPAAPTVDEVRRAAAAIGGGGTVVLADLSWTVVEQGRSEEFAAAAEAGGAALAILHPFADRTDALCLHPFRGPAHADDARTGDRGTR